MTGVAWTTEEDEHLKRLVDEHGTKKWALIATKIKTKGSKQCRRRWKNFLNMHAKNCSWSPDEDEQLILAHRIHGNRWTAIANIFGDRTDNAVKNRWAALTRKNPGLADDEGAGASAGGYDHGQPLAKRQRVGEGQSVGAFQPYSAAQGQFAPSMIGHINGQPVTSMPTPFDQHLLLQPPQQQQHLLSVQRVMPLGQAQQQQQQHEQAAPLSIVVNKDFLNPSEMTLVQQINQAHAPVHIEVAERPVAVGPDVTAELVTKRSSWRQFVDSLDEPNKEISDILAWFNNSSAAGQLMQGPTGRRLTRSLSKLVASGGAESLNDDHRSLLVRLMSKGLEYRTTSEQAELDLVAASVAGGGEPAAAGGGGGGEAPGNHRADPMRRTRSSRKSMEMEGASASAAGGGASPALADQLLNSGFPGFSVNEGNVAAVAAAQPAAAAASAAGPGPATRRASFRRQQEQQQSMPLSMPSFGDPFGDVLLTPTFTSQEITMLIEALTPGMGSKAH